MKLYRSNRLERLLDALEQVVGEPTGDALAPECIVVPSRGTAVWASLRLAERFGVWCNASFPFVRRFVDDTMRAVLGERAATLAAFEPQRLMWSVLTALQDHLPARGVKGHEAFAELGRMCEDDPRGAVRFGLAQRVADLFDQYAIHRPELVLGWEQGAEPDDWQAILWRCVIAKLGSGHAAALGRALLSTLASVSAPPAGLPARVCVFGIATLAPFHLEVLAALSRLLPVHLFVTSPSQEWWSEIRAARERGAAADEGNPLLASFGAIGRDFQRVLEAAVDYDEPLGDLHVDPAYDDALAVIQADVLHLRRRGVDVPRAMLRPGDDSIAVVSCHGRLREVEVMHDRLLDLLSRDQTLQPRDILVLCTDIDAYAPLVEAVLEREGETDLPFSLSDRSLRRESPTVDAFERILDLVGGRASASEVLDLLALEPIQRRFELSPDDVDRLAAWVDDVGVRWGTDSRHRAAHGQPRVEQNTWRFGLARLLLGFAMPTRGRAVFAEVLPYDEIEGQDAALAGRLAEFCTRLFGWLSRLEEACAPEAWSERLGRMIDDLLVPAESDAWAVRQIRAVLADLALAAETAGFAATVPLPAWRALLTARLQTERPMRGFLAGGVTVCALAPMRSLPARVVYVLGLGDGDFPRADRPVEFDKLQSSARPGDRSRRADDRWGFLETLLAAREHLVLSHVGRGIQDDRDLPPSVVLAELLDVLADSFAVAEGELDEAARRHAVRARVLARHPLQPFSPRCFGADPDPRLHGFAAHWLDGARTLARAQAMDTWRPMFTAALPPPRDADAEITIERLTRFFMLPVADLLRRRLGLEVGDDARERDDREPLELDGLDHWRVGTELLAHRLDGIDDELSLELLRASGELPLGQAGNCRFEQLRRTAERIAELARRARAGATLPALRVDVELPGARIVGNLRDRCAAGLVIPRFSRLAAKYQLEGWIRHLVLSAVRPPDSDARTVVVGRGNDDDAQAYAFDVVDDARDRLSQLVALFRLGQCQPLPLFPRASLAWCEKIGKGVETAHRAARNTFGDGEFAERNHPAVARVWGAQDPTQPGFRLLEDGPEFAEIAASVVGPLVARRRDC